MKMKLRNITYGLAVLLLVSSCYEDKGNYDYHDINEIEISGIDPLYEIDQYDMLVIEPNLAGTLYSDTERFTYEWEIDRKIVSEEFKLEYEVENTPGNKNARFIVTDKQTGIKSYMRFSLTVTSSTSGDLVMVLSKHNGKAEMSYLRLPTLIESGQGITYDWVTNYYEERFGQPLGTNPQQLCINYIPSARDWPFTTLNAWIMAVVDNKVMLMDKGSLQPDPMHPHLVGTDYTYLTSYPPADVTNYNSQFVMEGINIWRSTAYGSGFQITGNFAEVSGGSLYGIASIAPSTWTATPWYNKSSPYGGQASPFIFFDAMDPTPDSHLTQLGYTNGDIIAFDYNYGRFFKCSAYGGIAEMESMPTYPDFRMIWGSATVMADQTAIAVLANDNESRLVLFKTVNREKELVGESSGGGVINANSKFYVMKYNSYMFFVTGDKLYRYNMLDIQSNVPPSERNLVAKLSDYGYDANAVITDICVSRTEETILLGVSRYGSDTEGNGDELKGDIVWLDLNSSTLEVKHNTEKSQRGVSGIPVEVKIKYSTHWRDGVYRGERKDNI